MILLQCLTSSQHPDVVGVCCRKCMRFKVRTKHGMIRSKTPLENSNRNDQNKNLKNKILCVCAEVQTVEVRMLKW